MGQQHQGVVLKAITNSEFNEVPLFDLESSQDFQRDAIFVRLREVFNWFLGQWICAAIREQSPCLCQFEFIQLPRWREPGDVLEQRNYSRFETLEIY